MRLLSPQADKGEGDFISQALDGGEMTKRDLPGQLVPGPLVPHCFL